MPLDLALADLFRPYILLGESTAWHAALSVIYVESWETATGPDGVVIRGIARFSGDIDLPSFDPTTGTLRASTSNTEGHPATQPDRREPWLDITDTRVEFALTVQRAAGSIITAAVASISDTAFGPARRVLETWDATPDDSPPSDYPGTGFALDLVLSGIEIRPPLLHPAKMEANGLLVPDTSRNDVVFELPKVKVRLSQGSGNDATLDAALVSLGVSGLDDPGDLSAAKMISMQPAYAFIGTGRVVGFAFRTAYLDMADGYTPPEILDQFGFDARWTGLYLPEIRLFFAPHGAEDFAVNAGVENFLIGLGDSSGITGDFDLAVINQGNGHLKVSARFFDTQGHAIGITPLTEGHAQAYLPATTRMVVDVSGGRPPYAVSVNYGGSDHNGVVHAITLSGTRPEPIGIQVTDTSSPPKTMTLTITARRREENATQPPPGATPPLPATLETTSITLEGEPRTSPSLRLLSDSGSQVVIGIDQPTTPTNTQWQIDGGSSSTRATLPVSLEGDQTRTVRATLQGQTCTTIDGYFRYDKPPKNDPIGYALDPGNSSADPAVDPSGNAMWMPPGRTFLGAWKVVLAHVDPKTLTITGTASYENDEQKARYNYLLSQRRSQGLAALINADPQLATFSVNNQPTGSTPSAGWTNQWKTQGAPRAQWWKATISGFSVTLPGPVIEGRVHRPATAPAPPAEPTPLDTPPETPKPPDWFRSARLKVRIVQDQFVAVQLSGAIDYETEIEGHLRHQGVSAAQMPSIRGMGSNPADGIVDYLFLYQTDPASQSDDVKLYIGADPRDRDGLAMTGQLPGQPLEDPSFGRNILGMTTLFTPLLAEIAPDNPADGGITPIVLSAAVIGVPTALAEIEVGGERLLNVERVILFGGEIVFRRTGERYEASVLCDVETALSAKIKLGGFLLLEIPREKPLAVRYKAIGLSLGRPPGSTASWELRPVFDQSKGYTIDVSGPGAIHLPDPLGQLLQVLGARIARTNPLNFEIDLGFAVDLGVISVDRARVRIPLSPPGPPELTAFGAGIKVPGVIEGKGYMEMNNANDSMEIKGGIDVSLVALKLRVAAQIAVAQIAEADGGPATGVAIALEVELPVAIPLAQSGFGIYGFLGLFAMHYRRDEDGINSLTPALTWLKERAQGNPANLKAWKPQKGSWAFGAGITLGTMGSPIIFNVKGMFLLELPGPRILLVVKANLLAVMPELKDKKAEGTFLCVIDLDLGRGTLTIGISTEFSIKPIVEIKIPIEAYFNLKDGGDWHVYLGTFPGNDTLGRPMPGPIRINVLEVFNGAGYLMISGHGIPAYQPSGSNMPALNAVNGTGLAVGLEVSLIWGNTSINLYLRVTAGFNAVLGFDPFYVGGLLYLRGELRLFIISLSASAGLTTQIGQKIELISNVEVRTEISRIDGEVCGKLDLFFFTLKGCVDFHIGEDHKILPPAPDLVTAVSLVSRSPALVQGTGVDRGIDSQIGTAVAADSEPAHDPAAEGDTDSPNTMPVVPIDAIPVLTMSATPRDDSLQIFGHEPVGSPGAPADGFVKRGDFSYRYELKEILLETADGSPAVMAGNAPSVWWTQNSAQDTNLTAQLALLNWTPNPTPKALERTEFLENNVSERWGTLCHDAAPAAPVLWTFNHEPLGPSERGWEISGIAWPDPSDTERSSDPATGLRIHETWRSGDQTLDRQRGIVPAVIEGSRVPCAPGQDQATTRPTQPGGLVAHRPALTGIPAAGDLLTLGSGTFRPVTASTATSLHSRLSTAAVRLAAATAGSTGKHFSDTLDAPPLSVNEVLRRLAAGEAIHRYSVLSSAQGAGRDTGGNAASLVARPPFNNNGPKCDGRILASPLWDVGKPVVFGNLQRADAIAEQLDSLGHQHGPLADVLRIETGAVLKGAILMWVNRELLNKERGRTHGLVIHFLDTADHLLDVRPVRFNDLISVATLPEHWIDPDGPWYTELYPAFAYGQVALKSRVPVLVELAPPAGATHMEVGVLYENGKQAYYSEQNGRPYYIGAIELTTQAEQSRSEYDQKQIARSRKVVEHFLGPQSADVALMFPGKTYRVTTVTDVKVKDDEGNVQDDAQQTGTFWFRTDDTPPQRLDPWLLCSLPAEKESHVFGHEALKIIFATNDIDKLFGAYNKVLRARLKAASFRQVDEPGVPHPLPIDATTLENVQAHILSPFEAVLEDIVSSTAPCIPIDENRVRHSSLSIPIPLDPYTDYVLDIEAVDIGADPTTVGSRVLRRAFSTGAFHSTEAFADDFAGTATEHRAVTPGVMQAMGTKFSSRAAEGAEFDQALMDAGLEAMAVPGYSRVIIFWEQATPETTPQPAALLLDASEPIYRTRALPTEVTSDDPVPITRIELVERAWLTLEESSGGGHIVDHIVYAPGRQRALITFKAGSRSKVLGLDLVRRAFTEPYLDGAGATDRRFQIVAETLRQAPWEEV